MAKNKNCVLYQINGVKDHLHLLVSLHPSIALADLVKDTKVCSSIWIKEQKISLDSLHSRLGMALSPTR